MMFASITVVNRFGSRGSVGTVVASPEVGSEAVHTIPFVEAAKRRAAGAPAQKLLWWLGPKHKRSVQIERERCKPVKCMDLDQLLHLEPTQLLHLEPTHLMLMCRSYSCVSSTVPSTPLHTSVPVNWSRVGGWKPPFASKFQSGEGWVGRGGSGRMGGGKGAEGWG
jgi:hypothetical protein